MCNNFDLWLKIKRRLVCGVVFDPDLYLCPWLQKEKSGPKDCDLDSSDRRAVTENFANIFPDFSRNITKILKRNRDEFNGI